MAGRPRKANRRENEMQDRQGQARPTPERIAKGSYRVGETSRAGIRFVMDEDATPIRAAHRRGKLTRRQVDAAEAYEEHHTSVWGRGGSRDCLDTSPRGGASHESDSQQMRWASANRRLNALMALMDAKVAKVLFDVCVNQEAIGDCRPTYKRYQHLVLGLDICADFYKI